MAPIDARRGTPLWGLNRFRSECLAALLDDLNQLETVGLTPDDCQRVQAILAKIVDLPSAAADGSWFRGHFYRDLVKLRNLYVEWNGASGPNADVERRYRLEQMRRQRKRLSERVARNQPLLAEEIVDTTFVRSLVSHLGDLCEALPSTFGHLADELIRYRGTAFAS